MEKSLPPNASPHIVLTHFVNKIRTSLVPKRIKFVKKKK